MNLAILGMGWAGQRQFHACHESGTGLSVGRIIDRDPDHLASLANECPGAEASTAWDDAYADPDIDAVSICLPHALHAGATLQALEAGKHVLCEKPLAPTVAEAWSMVTAARRHKRMLMVAESLVFEPMSGVLRGIVTANDPIGPLVGGAVVTGFRAESYGYRGRRSWLSNPEAGGSGHWLLNGIHTVAQIRHVFGEVDTIYLRHHATDAFDRADVEATLTGVVTLAGGAQVTLIQSCEIALKGGLKGITIFGRDASLFADSEGYWIHSQDTGRDGPHRYPESALSAYATELIAFREAVENGTEPVTSGAAESRSLAVVEAGFESVRTGQPVHLPSRYPEVCG